MAKRAAGRRDGGFTLVELMVVIAIIGILAALVVPSFMKNLDESKVTAAKAQINLFGTSLMQYKIKVGKFPSTGEGLNALIQNSSGQSFLNASTIPPDPWGNPYVYVCPGTKGHDYEITSYGEDGTAGGSDYAADIVSWDLAGNANKPGSSGRR
jgi:general secretion pathway protein G